MAKRSSRVSRSPKWLIMVISALLFGGCNDPGPEDLWASNTAEVAVETGDGWGQIRNSRPLTVLRDNPSLWGYLRFEGTVVAGLPPEGRAVPHDSSGTHYSVWNRSEFRFTAPEGATYSDDFNDGYLGVAAVGGGVRDGYVRYHTNGLLLEPGRPTRIALQLHEFVGRPYEGHWRWRDFINASAAGEVRLDPRTAVVPVRVILVDEPGQPRWIMSEARAQLWFDGRTVDRRGTSVSAGGSLNGFVADHDPRPRYGQGITEPWGPDATRGITSATGVQQVDSVWCICGKRRSTNIQFRLTGFQHVSAETAGERCSRASGIADRLVAQTCLRAWISAARRELSGPSDRAVWIAFVHDYAASGSAVGEAFLDDGIIMSDEGLSSHHGARHPENVMAHELAHFLGGNSPLFIDGYHPPDTRENLMNDGSPVLTEEQCNVAYDAAVQRALFPVSR
jgi:hypothetical protein